MADKSSTPEGAPAEAPASGGGGIKPFIPLLANVIAMPVLAYLMVVFVLIPKLQTATAPAGESKEEPVKHEASAKSEGKSEKGGKEEKKGAKGEGAKGVKFAAPLSKKVIVNVAKSQGTRYLLAEITVVSTKSEIEELVKEHDAELRSAAINVMYTKTLSDLEQPQAMAQIRAELLSGFSTILGNGMVKEIYLTEFAIQ